MNLSAGAVPDDQSAPVAQVLTLMQESLARFQHTLQHLTSIVQLTAEAAQPAASTPLADVVRNVLLDLALPIAAAGARVSVAVAACPTVAFPEKHLRSVIFNLLSNAVKYCHPDRVPHVQLRAAQTPQTVSLEVQDNGLGISETQQQQLFGLFQRLHTHVEGSGVGLYSSKRLVENVGGTITVESQLGVGTTFTIQLPASVLSQGLSKASYGYPFTAVASPVPSRT